MKRNLLVASMLFVGMTATYAQQLPDASSWKVGDEITDKISWSNLKFENDEFEPWQLESTKGSFTKTGGLFEVYDGADVDLYQYVQLPAGMYKMEAQAYYRCGNSWADDPGLFGTDEWQDLAQMYVANGTYNVDDNSFVPGRTFQTPLMPRLFEKCSEKLYTMPEGEAGWDMSDGLYLNETVYGPTSVPGSLAWFNAGKYQAYDDGLGTRYNTVSFFLTEDGYVRVGITKKEPKSADSFMATNFKMFYMGEAGEAAELMALQEEVQIEYNKMENLRDNNDGLFGSLCLDALSEFDEEHPSISSMTKEECIEAKAKLKQLFQDATEAQEYIAKIEGIVPSMKHLADKNYPGKDAFVAAIEAAEKCIDPNCDITGDETFAMFKDSYNGLLNARMPYLLSQDKVEGAYDFSAVISRPFFCEDKYTPVWNAEANAFVFPTIEDVADELQPENTWATIQEQGYSDAKAQAGRESWIPIAENLKIVDNGDAPGQWNIKQTTWHNGSLGITMQHSYPAIGGWTAEPSGNPEIITQTITNIPNGYYSMSALMCNAGGDISKLQYVFIKSGEKEEHAPLTMKGNPWWGGNKEAWRSGVWEKLKTGVIKVNDGTVTIGSASDAFYAVTGFQLQYYGENVDYTSLLAKEIDAVKANVETLMWMGDKKAANAILAQLPTEIITEQDYAKAKDILKQTTDYVVTANSVANSNFKPADKYYKLAEAYEEGTPEYDIIINAWASVLSMEEDETAGIYHTYKDAIEANEIYNAYESYINYRASIGDYIQKPDVAKVVAEQNDILSKKYASVEELSKYQSDIALVYNKVLLADKNIDLSKATEDNPVDVTLFVANSGFEEGKTGWTGDMTNDRISGSETLYFGVPERYNTTFDINQTIHSLPAGYYRVKCQAFYRDGGDANQAYKNWQAAGYDKELWDTGIAYLYANDRQVKVNSLGSEYPTEYMTEYIEKYENAEEGSEGTPVYQRQDVENPSFNHPWDTKVTDGEETFYYPNSIYGSKNLFTKHPEMYNNEIDVYVEEGGNLTFGLRKTEKIGNDWSMFDNFQLFYIGTQTPTGINATEIANGANAEGIYTISGVKTNSMNKGINIIKMSDGTVKKVVK